MFSCRVANDFHHRSRNGQPSHSTTGVASNAWTHWDQDALIQCGAPENSPSIAVSMLNGRIILPIVIINSGIERTSPTHKRRVIDSGSIFRSCVPAGSTGSRRVACAAPATRQDATATKLSRCSSRGLAAPERSGCGGNHNADIAPAGCSSLPAPACPSHERANWTRARPQVSPSRDIGLTAAKSRTASEPH